MGKLVLFLKDASPVEIPLSKERVTIGRRPDNDVCLPYPAVSGEHAAVVTILADSFLEDLGSTNGTLVNGRPVAKHFLRDRDQIDIGRQLLVYLADDDARAEPPPGVPAREDRREPTARAGAFAKPARPEAPGAPRLDADVGARIDAPRGGPPGPEPHSAPALPSASEESHEAPVPARAIDETFDAELAAIRQARVDTAAALPPEAPEPAPEPPAPVHARLRVLTGPSAGRVVPIAREEFVLGRVGVQVAAIEVRDGALVLAAREGAEPPTVNGEPVPPEGREVRPGDGLEVAGARLEVLAPE